MSDFTTTTAPRTIRRAIWDGSIPVQILLNPGESRIFDSSDPFYIQLPRLSYLPFIYPQLYAFFLPDLIDGGNAAPEKVWLEFEGVPLRWHWPVGLLYDLLTGRDPGSVGGLEGGGGGGAGGDGGGGVGTWQTEDEHRLPWTLTVHFEELPGGAGVRRLVGGVGSGGGGGGGGGSGSGTGERDLIKEGVQDAFVNSLKEADYMRNGNARGVMGLSMKDSDRLWTAVETHDFDMYWSVADKLFSSSVYPIRNIPLKIYLPSGIKVIQRLISPYLPNRDPITIGAVLRMMIPELFQSPRTAIIARPVLHGIVIPMATPLVELLRDGVYMDGFLHVAVAMMS